MAFSVICPGCSTKLNTPDGSEGKTLQCPKCRQQLVVPHRIQNQIQSGYVQPPLVRQPLIQPSYRYKQGRAWPWVVSSIVVMLFCIAGCIAVVLYHKHPAGDSDNSIEKVADDNAKPFVPKPVPNPNSPATSNVPTVKIEDVFLRPNIGFHDTLRNRYDEIPREAIYIVLKVTNTSKNKVLRHVGWLPSKSPINLVDEHGNQYLTQGLNFGNVFYLPSKGSLENTYPVTVKTLYPHESVIDFVIFEKPAVQATKLTLTLPATTIGDGDPLVFTIDATKLKYGTYNWQNN